MNTAPALREHLSIVIERFGHNLALDLSGVEFLDSTGLAVLITYWKTARAAGGLVCLVAPAEPVMHKLKLTGLDRRLAVHPDVESVLAAHRARSYG